MKVLAFCDAPIKRTCTGFSRVAQNILERWQAWGVATQIDVWGIGWEGYDYHTTPLRLLPAGMADWKTPQRLSQFLAQLRSGNYTHVWILCDADWLSCFKFPETLQKICREKNIRTMLYYPLDARMEPEWTEMIRSVDVAVTYTDYARRETLQALGKSRYPISVIPHGVDEVFKPLPVEVQEQYRDMTLEIGEDQVKFIEPGDFVMLNVNKNEHRKDLLRSMEILAVLRRCQVPAKLILRTDPVPKMHGGVNLEMAARQLGLTYGQEWCHLGSMPDVMLAGLYNAADLYLTTTLGEGWGLGVTEALACGCPVAMPCHTSLAEIGARVMRVDEGVGMPHPLPIQWLPLEEGFVTGHDSRLRRRVDLMSAVQAISYYWESNFRDGKRPRAVCDLSDYQWDRVARDMWEAYGQ